MNDRYLYRAKRIDNGEWVEGYVFDDGFENGRMFVGGLVIEEYHGTACDDWNVTGINFYEVDPSNICQCTAMPDKNRKIAYEHDIIKTPVGNAKIIWNCSPSPTDHHINVGFEIVFLDAIANDNYRHDLGYWIGKSEVIGSVFDNSELLE